MSISSACCTLLPVESSYTAQGTEWKLDDLTIYETLDKTPKRILICVYDIFGFHPNTKQFCDRLGQSGLFRVAMPDFFRGSPISLENFPPKNMEEIYNFVQTKGSWGTVKVDLDKVLDHYKKEGCTSVGIFGFCWGGKMACNAASEIDGIHSAGLIHPSLLTLEDMGKVNCPMILLPTKDEEDMEPFYKKLQERWGDSCEHVRFEDMFHGFAGARGNLEDELNRKRVDEAINLLHAFCTKHVK